VRRPSQGACLTRPGGRPGRKRERGLREGYLDLDGPMPRTLRQRLLAPRRAWRRRYFVVSGLRTTFGKAGHQPELLCYAQHSQVLAPQPVPLTAPLAMGRCGLWR